MQNRKTTDEESLRTELDSIAESILRATDEEIEEMLASEGVDVREAAERSRRILRRAVAEAGELSFREAEETVSTASKPTRPLEFPRG